jgi:hypothetical protein
MGIVFIIGEQNARRLPHNKYVVSLKEGFKLQSSFITSVVLQKCVISN